MAGETQKAFEIISRLHAQVQNIRNSRHATVEEKISAELLTVMLEEAFNQLDKVLGSGTLHKVLCEMQRENPSTTYIEYEPKMNLIKMDKPMLADFLLAVNTRTVHGEELQLIDNGSELFAFAVRDDRQNYEIYKAPSLINHNK